MLCHGYTGSAHDFALNIDALSARRPVLALDLRGHGRSHHAADESRYSLEQLADDLVAFLEANGDGAVDLLGHSMGGWVSLAATIERPDLVRSLILMDTSAWRFGDTDDELRVLYAAFLHGFDPCERAPRPQRSRVARAAAGGRCDSAAVADAQGRAGDRSVCAESARAPAPRRRAAGAAATPRGRALSRDGHRRRARSPIRRPGGRPRP
ncbi:MAG: alpha/beta hydrolase [Ilumatobacteraceae bacterium]